MTRASDADAPKTVDDLCRVTGLSRELVWAEIKAGRLPGYVHPMRRGAKVRYVIPADAFRRYVAGDWRPSQAPAPEPIADHRPSDFIKRKAS